MLNRCAGGLLFRLFSKILYGRGVLKLSGIMGGGGLETNTGIQKTTTCPDDSLGFLTSVGFAYYVYVLSEAQHV